MTTPQQPEKTPEPVTMDTRMIRKIFRAEAETRQRNLRQEHWSKVAGLAVFVFGTVVMTGWLLELQACRRFLGWLVTMKANTALSFLLCGVALWLLRRQPPAEAAAPFQERRQWLGAGYALVVILIGLLTLAQYLFGVSIGIDHLVFLPPAVAAPYFQTGPMEIETATNFILIGVALVLINIRGYRTVVRLLIGLVVAICVSSLLGLFRGITLPPSSPPVAPMAALTVAMFFLLCVGLLLAGRQFDQTDQNWPPNTPP